MIENPDDLVTLPGSDDQRRLGSLTIRELVELQRHRLESLTESISRYHQAAAETTERIAEMSRAGASTWDGLLSANPPRVW